MRWINTDPAFVPYLAQVMDMVVTANCVCVSEFDDEKPIAGALFEGYNGKAIHSHIWIAPGRRPSRRFWWACFDYMFRQCGVETVIGTVPSSNMAARKLDEHLGYRLNSVVPNYYPNGDDMLLYVCTPATAMDWQRLAPKPVKSEERDNGQESQKARCA